MFFILRTKKKVGKVSNFEKFRRQKCRLRNDAFFHQKLIYIELVIIDKCSLNEQVFKEALSLVTRSATANYTALLKN